MKIMEKLGNYLLSKGDRKELKEVRKDFRKLLGKDEKMDLSQPVFFAEQLRQDGYDREIDEGMSSGIKRYVTLDVTELPEKQVMQLIKKLVKEFTDFSTCKLVQVAGFNKEDKRYLVVSGESHVVYQGSVKNSASEKVMKITDGLPVEQVEEYITPPVEEEPYEPVNLGKYGSTGCPSLGIEQHPEAEGLREAGTIRR